MKPNPNPYELRVFMLFPNRFLRREADGYYVLNYPRYGQPGNPEFILTLKNTFGEKCEEELMLAENEVVDILCKYVPDIMRSEGLSSCVMMCVPRAKAFSTYLSSQMYFQDGVSEAAGYLANVTDGTRAIIRTVDTKTTHLGENIARKTADGTKKKNDGSEPYPGITKDTCAFDRRLIKGEDIILVEDIYTQGVNIDEDCVQALYDLGANRVILFAISRTTVG